MATTPAMITGTYRFVHRDSNDNTIAELLEKHSFEFGGAVGVPISDPQRMPKVKKALSTILREDDKLVLMLKPDVLFTKGGLETADARVMRIPVTFRNRRSGVIYEKTLVKGDFTDKKVHAEDDTYKAGIWYDIEEYVIPAQSELKLGHAIQDVRV
ncbi:unnamed protein product, partial [marine sediment metagenome]